MGLKPIIGVILQRDDYLFSAIEDDFLWLSLASAVTAKVIFSTAAGAFGVLTN